MYDKMYLVFESMVILDINKEKLEIEDRAIKEIKSYIVTLRNYLLMFKALARTILTSQIPPCTYQPDGSLFLHENTSCSIWCECVSHMDMYVEFLVDVLPYLEPNLSIHDSCHYNGPDYYKTRIEHHPGRFHVYNELVN